MDVIYQKTRKKEKKKHMLVIYLLADTTMYFE
jgi:hypothetical protein